jgi:aldehyde:ferredoxin oxidoreductase
VRLGERSFNLKHLINARLGVPGQPGAIRLPSILMQPLAEGGTGGYVAPLEQMFAAYCAARGWSATTGQPQPATLKRLGLAELAQQDHSADPPGGSL